MSFNQKEWWDQVGHMPNVNIIKTHIWSPFGEDGSWVSEKMYEPHLDILKEKISFNKVLDFGCGLGRNFNTLDELFKEVYGFDTCPMIEKLTSIHDEEKLGYKRLACDWVEHSDAKYDCVFECTVFQHIPVEEVKTRLRDISQMTKYLVGTFRAYNDENRDFSFGTGGYNMMQIVDGVDCFDIVDCSITHQKASSLMDDTHYNILLKSR